MKLNFPHKLDIPVDIYKRIHCNEIPVIKYFLNIIISCTDIKNLAATGTVSTIVVC
jgi:hypothetical protein